MVSDPSTKAASVMPEQQPHIVTLTESVSGRWGREGDKITRAVLVEGAVGWHTESGLWLGYAGGKHIALSAGK